MKIDVQRLLSRYTAVLSVGGLIILLAVLVVDTRWMSHPFATAILMASILIPAA